MVSRIKLRECQKKAVDQLSNGKILCGGVGSGKSRTSIAYYFKTQGGDYDKDVTDILQNPKDLYIITTARKRDTKEWEAELALFMLSTDDEHNAHGNHVYVDSWNNIKKYQDVTNAFFIFDEQRVVGSGQWVKAFLKIARGNNWILLSATPGDTWTDYIPVFIANGFYKNRTEFIREHVIYKRFAKFPQIDKFIKTGRLIKYRNDILVDILFQREAVQHHIDLYADYDTIIYKSINKDRWNPYENKPIETASEYCHTLRRLVNSDESRVKLLTDICKEKGRVIIFYNFDYELDILRSINFGVPVAEWNGHKHQPIPETEGWVYLVQYTAGAEGWNCVRTDTIIFYSQNYSYKVMVQAAGRIDRMNTSYRDLYYYHLKSRSGIDLAINKALVNKKKFNETKFYGG